MARGMRNLAALAAMGALGYKLSKDQEKERDPNAVIVQDRSIKVPDSRAVSEVDKPASPTVSAPALNSAPQKPAKRRFVHVGNESAELPDPQYYEDIAEDIMAKPRLIRGMSAKQLVNFITNPVDRSPTDTESRRANQLLDPQGRFLRGGAGPFVTDSSGEPIAVARKKGGPVKAKKMASGGMSSASKRGDGIATKGKTKCKIY